MVAMVIMKGSWEDDLMIPWISLVGDDDNHYNDDDGGDGGEDEHEGDSGEHCCQHGGVVE